jgi:hypothetical protein
MPRLVEERMEGAKGVLVDEMTKGRGYTEDQAARFAATGEVMREVLRTTFELRKKAVEMVWKESEVKDPPKEAPWWQALALAALKAATGGVAGVFIDMAATALTGGDAKPGEEKSIGAKIGKAVISKVLEKGAEAIIDKVFSTESEKSGGGGGKEGVASNAATSTDPKIAFFESQSDTLIAAGQGSQEEAIGQIADLRGGPDFA